MRLNADFSKRVVVKFDETDWVPSPMPGVERKMLDRIGEEVARATSIVRYAPGSAFSPHVHDGGEEYLVLEGVFQDEHGDFPVGSYVRNPPTSSHTPAAKDGAVILVKLHQFDPEDRTQVLVDYSDGTARALHEDASERVRIETFAPGAAVEIAADGGLELFVLDGGMSEGGYLLGRWDWLRVPPGGAVAGVAGDAGLRAWVKTGHLAALV